MDAGGGKGYDNYTPFTEELENNKQMYSFMGGMVGYIIRKTILFTILIAKNNNNNSNNNNLR